MDFSLSLFAASLPTVAESTETAVKTLSWQHQ